MLCAGYFCPANSICRSGLGGQGCRKSHRQLVVFASCLVWPTHRTSASTFHNETVSVV